MVVTRLSSGALCLAVDADATAERRVVVADPDYPEVTGLALDFDRHGHLIGVEFEDPDRHVPAALLEAGRPTHATRDEHAGLAYLALQPIGRGGVAETLTCDEGVNLDFDAAWKLVGIELPAR